MGPHVDVTSRIGAFKVMSVAASNWKGDVTLDRFQRVYGTAYFGEADLAARLEALEQAKARAHRVIGRKLGLFDRLTALLTPFFRAIGIAPPLAPLVTIGMLLGLSYGGGLIVEETKKHPYTSRELFTPLAGLSVIHAVLEDTFVVIALGANIWVILVWHTLYALLVIALIGAIIRLLPRKAIAPSRPSL